MDRKVLAVVLAAGASRRFGSPKQLALVGNLTLVEHIQTVLLGSSVDEVSVVVGSSAEAIEPYILPGAKVWHNEQWDEGIAASIRCAAQYAAETQASHLFLFACDQPFVTPCLVDKIVNLSKFDPDKIIACKYGDSVGVPALFPNNYFELLRSLRGDSGAKSIIKKAAGTVFVEFPQGVTDVDYPSDLPLQI
ncbi:MAG: nucleotidyltransferase family protein [Candidatus Melainabacteria bacterium]|nr:MAG: nucleotidyltransferase family protein [Candidatus Melainabacteria bacterium]